MPEIKNDRVHWNVNFPLKRKSSPVQVYLPQICNSLCRTAWGEVRRNTLAKADSTWCLHVSKWTRMGGPGWGAHIRGSFHRINNGPFWTLTLCPSWETDTPVADVDILLWTDKVTRTLEYTYPRTLKHTWHTQFCKSCTREHMKRRVRVLTDALPQQAVMRRMWTPAMGLLQPPSDAWLLQSDL